MGVNVVKSCKSRLLLIKQPAFAGPRWETRTPDILLPNHAFYQLNYTRIFNFCHYTTAREIIKDFSVCGLLRSNPPVCRAKLFLFY